MLRGSANRNLMATIKVKGTSVTCFNCGKKGHYANKCTNPTSTAPVATGASREWMKIQPTAGSPETKEVNGRTWHWCGGCNSWSTTHGTATHKNKVKEGESPPDPAAVPPPIGAEGMLQPFMVTPLVVPCSLHWVLEEPGNGTRMAITSF